MMSINVPIQHPVSRNPSIRSPPRSTHLLPMDGDNFFAPDDRVLALQYRQRLHKIRCPGQKERRVKMAEYKVKFEVFEGPLDLLLYLIKKEEVDIYEVNLTRLAEQFIEYIETMRLLDLEIAGEFLVMAATLMYIKSRELLPVEQRAEVEGDDEGEDPRWELIRQLVEYKKFKDAASQLQTLELRQADVFARVPGKLEFEHQHETPRADASIFDLVNAVNSVLQRF